MLPGEPSMCTLVILRRPEHDWPLILAANRDEMVDRTWQGPGRHWTDRPEVVAGLDKQAGGSWLGINDFGVVAGVLNRPGSLGPDRDKRSRGELVLEALDHADATEAARELRAIDGRAYRPFNLVIADNQDAFWLKSDGSGKTRLEQVPAGLSMITAHDLNSQASARIRAYLPRFREAPAPVPEEAAWDAWIELLSNPEAPLDSGPEDAMRIETPEGFGTVNSSLLALPAWGTPIWLFAGGLPGISPFERVGL